MYKIIHPVRRDGKLEGIEWQEKRIVGLEGSLLFLCQ